jgi:hypothetical protein
LRATPHELATATEPWRLAAMRAQTAWASPAGRRTRQKPSTPPTYGCAWVYTVSRRLVRSDDGVFYAWDNDAEPGTWIPACTYSCCRVRDHGELVTLALAR